MRCANSPDFLPARHCLTAAHQNGVEMPIERVDVLDGAVLPISMPHNDHVSPAQVTVARKHHDPRADAVNWIAEIGVSAADPIPIFAKMSIWSEAARFVVTLAIRYPHRKIKAVCHSRKRRLRSQANGLSGNRILFAG